MGKKNRYLEFVFDKLVSELTWTEEGELIYIGMDKFGIYVWDKFGVRTDNNEMLDLWEMYWNHIQSISH